MAVHDELGRGVVELIEHRQDGAAGVSEHRVHFMRTNQHFMQNLSPGFALVFGLARFGLSRAGDLGVGV